MPMIDFTNKSGLVEQLGETKYFQDLECKIPAKEGDPIRVIISPDWNFNASGRVRLQADGTLYVGDDESN